MECKEMAEKANQSRDKEEQDKETQAIIKRQVEDGQITI